MSERIDSDWQSEIIFEQLSVEKSSVNPLTSAFISNAITTPSFSLQDTNNPWTQKWNDVRRAMPPRCWMFRSSCLEATPKHTQSYPLRESHLAFFVTDDPCSNDVVTLYPTVERTPIIPLCACPLSCQQLSTNGSQSLLLPDILQNQSSSLYFSCLLDSCHCLCDTYVYWVFEPVVTDNAYWSWRWRRADCQ